jgi:biotin carboxyl carrier protein
VLVEIRSETAGVLWQMKVAVGQSVQIGDVLAVLESMKIEIPVLAPVGGVIVELRVAADAQVDEDQVIAVIDERSKG